jgi:hypothetical protein
MLEIKYWKPSKHATADEKRSNVPFFALFKNKLGQIHSKF